VALVESVVVAGLEVLAESVALAELEIAVG
jgi:hypothetical protein